MGSVSRGTKHAKVALGSGTYQRVENDQLMPIGGEPVGEIAPDEARHR